MHWQDNHYRPTLELLERRDLPTSALLSGGYLYVLGSSGPDYISISQSNGRISVSNTSISVGSAHLWSVDANWVSKVVVYGYGGGDVINLRPSAGTTVTKDSYIVVGPGNNQVYGGSGDNYIVAGGGGHNVISGGSGINHLVGGPNDQLLIGGFTWFYRPYNAGAPFSNGEAVSDVRQGKAPSCQSDAALAEAVKQGYNFANNIHYLGNSVYDVSLYGGSLHEHVTFNGWYTSDDPAPSAPGEYWTILMYRARLQALGINPAAHFTTAYWDILDRSMGGRVYSIADALEAFTGRHAAYSSIFTATPQGLYNAMARGDLVVASTPAGGGASADGIIRDHAYAVMAVYWQGGMWKVRLYNPWGFDGLGGRTIESLAGGAPNNRGFITLSWSQFVSSNNFQGVTSAPANPAQVAYFRSLGSGRE
jgi:hypothetical protein